jgi:hypothetical protein
MAAIYAASTKKGQMPELPEAYLDYRLYQKHSNVKVCTICDYNFLNKLTIGQRVVLTVRSTNAKFGPLDVIVSADGLIIGFLPVSKVKKAILCRRNMQWHEEAYIDSINQKGKVTLLIGIYNLDKPTILETERHAKIDLINASLS